MKKFASAPAQGANDRAKKQANPNSNAPQETDVRGSTVCKTLRCDARNEGDTE